MLRHMLISRLAVWVAVLLVVACGGMWLLRSAVVELVHIDAEGPRITVASQRVSDAATAIEQELFAPSPRHAESLIELLDELDTGCEALAEHAGMPHIGAEVADAAARMAGHAQLVRVLASPPSAKAADRDEALQALLSVRMDASELSSVAAVHTAAERGAVIDRVHATAIWLGVMMVLLIGGAGFALWRTARLVLRPIDALLKASRDMELKNFGARVPTNQPAEFAELARAYNSMAEAVQAGEAKTLETIQQLALTLNHELNNAINIIELQVERLNRQSPDNPRLTSRLTDIRSVLDRMTATVRSLLSVKRIVLTDYPTGQKMMDLRRSVEPDPDSEGSAWIQQHSR